MMNEEQGIWIEEMINIQCSIINFQRKTPTETTF
jgi:hypothetical protein